MHRTLTTPLLLFVMLFCASPALTADSQGEVEEFELKSRVYGNTRSIRVLLPPDYSVSTYKDRTYPVFYFTDGRAAFDEEGWGVPQVARKLWQEHAIPEIIFVGIDNGGSTKETVNPVLDRASEYIPYPDPTWTDKDAPEPKGDRFPEFLFKEVMPAINQRYRTKTGAANTGLAGASYGGAAVLYTVLMHPERIGFVLIESPSLHLGNGKLLQEAAAQEKWPPSIAIGVGTAEGETTLAQGEMLSDVRKLYALLERDKGTRVNLTVVDKGIHWFTAWKERLPAQVKFLLQQ